MSSPLSITVRSKLYTGLVYKIGSAQPGDDQPTLRFIGTHGDIVNSQILGTIAPVYTRTPTETLRTEGNVIFSTDERRTIIRSVTGNFKVQSGFNAQFIQIGSEIAAGFTVQSAFNETGVHSGEMAFELKVPASAGSFPTFQQNATLKKYFLWNSQGLRLY